MNQVTIKDIAGAIGVVPSSAKRRAAKNNWPYQFENVRGGKRKLFTVSSLPKDIQVALLLKQDKQPKATPAPAKPTKKQPAQKTIDYNRESLWEWAEKQTNKRREVGEYRANLLRKCVDLMNADCTFRQASEIVADDNGLKAANLRNWYYGVNKKTGARQYDIADWPAALISGYKPRQITAYCDPEAWDWIKGHFLNRRQVSFASSYRRLVEIASEKGWEIPSERTLFRRMESEVSIYTKTLLRQGAEALNKLYPTQTRDKRCFTAGQAVSGDGLKFDKLYVDWGDEILNTSTAWVWQDIYSGKLLAHRIAKTENTDLFRLATYDLTAICAPTYVQVDNTRVAANKAMTSGTKVRYRFKNRPDDHEGILQQLGMEVHFTSPDHTISNPGVKPIERAFGIGGIHDEVVTHPQLIGRGYSRKTAIPVDEFMSIVAQEVKRFNERKNRRSEVCNGVLSFDDAFSESYAKSEVRQLTESQRRLLLLMPERVKASASGVITLKAGAGPRGKNQYWHEALAEFKKSDLVIYYDPENLASDIAVYTLDGRFIANAQHKSSVAFNDTATAREHSKMKQRRLKAQKKAAEAETRMNNIERSAIYPEPDEPVDIPEPGVVRANFAQKRQVDEGMRITEAATVRKLDADEDLWQNFSDKVAAIRDRQREESL